MKKLGLVPTRKRSNKTFLNHKYDKNIYMYTIFIIFKNFVIYSLAFFESVFTFIGAIEKFSVEQLHSDDSKNELK